MFQRKQWMTDSRACRPWYKHRLARTCGALALTAAMAMGCGGSGDDDNTPDPGPGTPVAKATFTSPPSGSGTPFGRTALDLTAAGYVEQEFLADGSAKRYRIKDALANAEVVDNANAYTTRILVRRPTDAAKFNGTVIVEWLNVTAAQDVDFVFAGTYAHLLRQGYAWVGVSAQLAGTNALRAVNPTRYAAVSLAASNTDPAGGTLGSDVLSWDVYAQIGAALRNPGTIDPLGGLKPLRVIAAGESQSAFRLTSYYNSIHPLNPGLYDGFFLYDRVGRLRTDTDTKLLSFGSEYLHTLQGMPQADAGNLRVWEVAGAAHVSMDEVNGYLDELILRNGVSRAADGTPRTLSAAMIGCGRTPPLSRVPNSDVLHAGLEALMAWVTQGKAPPNAPRMGVDEQGRLYRDSSGLVTGGIRLAAYDAPIARNLGANTGVFACQLAGSHEDFTPAELCSRYGSSQNYVAKVIEVTRQAERDGFVLAADANRTIQQARAQTFSCP